MPSAWTLANVDDKHAAHPATFQIPPLWARQQLQPGRIVKLIFESAHGGERMWVRVEERLGARYRGTLFSEPVYDVGLSEGDRIDFGPEHIADGRPAVAPKVPSGLTATLSNALRDVTRFPRSVRREPPLDASDSGLRLDAGDGSDDPAQTTRMELTSIVAMYLPIAALVGATDSARWRWNEVDCRYDPVR